MKKSLLLSAIFMISTAAFSQKKPADVLKKLDQQTLKYSEIAQ